MNTPLSNRLSKFTFPKRVSDLLNSTRARALQLVHGVTSPSPNSSKSFSPPVSTSPNPSSASNDSFKMCSSLEYEGQYYLNETPIIKSRMSRSPFSAGVSNSSNHYDTNSVHRAPCSQIPSVSQTFSHASQHVANQNGSASDPTAEVSRIIRSALENALTSFLENPTNGNNSVIQGFAEDALHQLENPTVSALSTLRQFASRTQSQAPHVSIVASNSLSPFMSNSPLPVCCSQLCSGNVSMSSSSLVTSCSSMSSPLTFTTTSMFHPVPSVLPQTTVSSYSHSSSAGIQAGYSRSFETCQPNFETSHTSPLDHTISASPGHRSIEDLLQEATQMLNQLASQNESSAQFNSRISHTFNPSSVERNSVSTQTSLNDQINSEESQVRLDSDHNKYIDISQLSSPSPSNSAQVTDHNLPPIASHSFTNFRSCFPALQLEKFSGEYDRYESFKVRSTTLVSACNISQQEKAKILFRALDEDVVSKLDHIPNLNSDDAYTSLWESLDREFSRYQHDVASYILELTSELQIWPVVDTSSDIKLLYKFLNYHYGSLKQIGQESQMEHVGIRLLILSCLTGNLMEKFSTWMNGHSSEPIIENLLFEMKKEIKRKSLCELAINTKSIYSALGSNYDDKDEGLVQFSGNENKPLEVSNSIHNDQASQFFVDIGSENSGLVSSGGLSSSPVTERQRRFAKKCFFCISDNHEPGNCTLLNSPSDYKKILRRFKLCYNCFDSGHINSQCPTFNHCLRNCENSIKHSSLVCNMVN